ncbi:DUF262 domain-containing protein [Bacteroidota bacterium]
MRSIKAQDRELELWYRRIKDGEIKLPRFQRHESWDRHRITSLLNNIIHNLPLGVTLILEVDKEQFISKYIKTAEHNTPYPRVIEHLLDGQQRLTAFWRAVYNNYETYSYFVYLKKYDQVWVKENGTSNDEEVEDQMYVYCQARWIKKDGAKMPLWADRPEDCLKRGCIPFHLLRPDDIALEIETWIKSATEYLRPSTGIESFEEKYDIYSENKKEISDKIKDLREIVKHYNLPYLALPSETPKDTSLNVFINMNTNSKPLSQFDIIVAEIEGVKDTSLHDYLNELDSKFPHIKNYFELSYLILYTSALIQEKLPNKKGIWDMDKRKVIDNWDILEKGLSRMTKFLESQNLYDRQRLPTNAILAVIAAVFAMFPDSGDIAGKTEVLLKKYLWSAFFTDRYENSAAGRAYADFIAIKNYLLGAKKQEGKSYIEASIPVLNRTLFPISTPDELLTIGWPKNETIRGRGILAVANYFGANDFADDSKVTIENIKERHYHHIYPDALVIEAKEQYPEELQASLALNCSLITGLTNLKIGRKDPMQYLKDRYNWVDEKIIEQRLSSHLIPKNELEVGSYENMEAKDRADKIKIDYLNFIQTRALLIHSAVEKLVSGKEVFVSDIMS